jgi:hypothetical protein
MATKKEVKMRDLKPSKDAKGGTGPRAAGPRAAGPRAAGPRAAGPGGR